MSAAATARGGEPYIPPSVHLRGGALVAGILILALSNFMAVLDMTIVNVAVPHIAGGLAISPSEGTWVITSYAIAEAIMVPLSGWLAARFGAVRVFCTSAILFGIASTLCGFASSIQMLVAFRILQGLSGGPLMPMSQALLLRVTPPKRHNVSLGMWAMTTILAPIAGPMLGGGIADTIGWEWAFFINVPIAVICAVFAWNLLAVRETPIVRSPVDYVGLGLLVVWVGAMQLMLDNGEKYDWFESPIIVTFALVALIGFVMFVIWELGEEHPIVDLRIFRHRGFSIACIAMALTFGGYFASVVLIPLWLQLNMGYTATEAGRMMAFNGAFALFMAPLAASLMGRFDPRIMMTYGLTIVASTTLYRIGFAQNMTFFQLALPQLVIGLGMPFFFLPVTATSMATVDESEIASAAGLTGFVRTTSAAFATAIVTTAWQDLSTENRVAMAGRLFQPEASMAGLEAAGLNVDQARGVIDQLVQSQAVMLATNQMFLAIGAVIAVTAAGIWLMPKPKHKLSASASH